MESRMCWQPRLPGSGTLVIMQNRPMRSLNSRYIQLHGSTLGHRWQDCLFLSSLYLLCFSVHYDLTLYPLIMYFLNKCLTFLSTTIRAEFVHDGGCKVQTLIYQLRSNSRFFKHQLLTLAHLIDYTSIQVFLSLDRWNFTYLFYYLYIPLI